jgi:hypothetical protein
MAMGLAACLAVGGLSQSARAAEEKADGDAKQVDFVKDIQPILKESCIGCHQAPKAGGPGGPRERQAGPGGGRGPRGPAAGFRLDDKAAAMKGGKHGKAIIPGKAEESLMYQLLKGPAKRGDDEIAPMPKGRPGDEFKPLPEEKIELIKLWIDQGAKWGK